MIRRVLKELWAERGLLVFSLILMFILSLGLSVQQLNNYSQESCGMDAFSFSSEWMAVSVFIVCSFISISINKNNFKPERVVLSEKKSSVWNYTVVKTVSMSLVLALFIFVIVFLVSKMFFADFFNWDSEESVFNLLTGYQMEDINYVMFFLAYFFQIFFGICTAALMPLISFWYFRSYMIGALFIIVLNLTGMALGADFIYEQNVFYDKMIKGIDIRYHFIFPAIALVILMVAGSLKTKRDFI